MARKMGIQSVEIPAEEVIIRTSDKEIVIRNPQVSKVNMMGQETFQVIGEPEERSKKPYTDEDIETVSKQTGASAEDAENALIESDGDLAKAILSLKKE